MAELPEGSRQLAYDDYLRRKSAPPPTWAALDPRQGLSVWEALYYFVDPKETLDAYKTAEREWDLEITNRQAGALNFRVKGSRIRSGKFVGELVNKLRSGELVARGFASSAALDTPRQDVHKDRWVDLVLDARASQAHGPGVVISSILIFAAEGASPLLSHGRKRFSPVQLRAWYVKRLTELHAAGARSSREQDYAAATVAFDGSVTKRAVEELRKELAPADWQRGGRPRGSL